MTGVNFASVAALLGGSLYVVCKTYKRSDGKLYTTSYYFEKKEGAKDIIMNALNYTGAEDDNLISMTYARYNDLGHTQEFFTLYAKDERCEE